MTWLETIAYGIAIWFALSIAVFGIPAVIRDLAIHRQMLRRLAR